MLAFCAAKVPLLIHSRHVRRMLACGVALSMVAVSTGCAGTLPSEPTPPASSAQPDAWTVRIQAATSAGLPLGNSIQYPMAYEIAGLFHRPFGDTTPVAIGGGLLLPPFDLGTWTPGELFAAYPTGQFLTFQGPANLRQPPETRVVDERSGTWRITSTYWAPCSYNILADKPHDFILCAKKGYGISVYLYDTRSSAKLAFDLLQGVGSILAPR